jgi:hypothetical protein
MTKHFGRYKLFPLLKYMINRHTIWQPARHCSIEPYKKYDEHYFDEEIVENITTGNIKRWNANRQNHIDTNSTTGTHKQYLVSIIKAVLFPYQMMFIQFKSYTTGATNRTGTAYPYGTTEFTTVFSWVRFIQSKEWRDTRTFSNLKSTHCTLIILLIINLVAKKFK